MDLLSGFFVELTKGELSFSYVYKAFSPILIVITSWLGYWIGVHWEFFAASLMKACYLMFDKCCFKGKNIVSAPISNIQMWYEYLFLLTSLPLVLVIIRMNCMHIRKLNINRMLAMSRSPFKRSSKLQLAFEEG